jgi:DNA-binding CsgD family transcriptional regulator
VTAPWETLPPQHRVVLRQLAKRTLTGRQYQVWALHMSGFGYRRIGLALDMSVSTVRSHLDAAERRLRADPEYPREGGVV